MLGLGTLPDEHVRKPADRSVIGDGLSAPHVQMQRTPVGTPGIFYPGFRSLLQGDHMGVEFALESHSQLLQGAGCLHPLQRLRANHPMPWPGVLEALFIDDYVALSAQTLGDFHAGKPPLASKLHAQATAAYATHQVLGSPEKDVVGETLFTAIGAEVDARPRVVQGIGVLVGCPLGKRLSLAALSLRAARLPISTEKFASRLAGAWVSATMFRRPSMVTPSERLPLSRVFLRSHLSLWVGLSGKSGRLPALSLLFWCQTPPCNLKHRSSLQMRPHVKEVLCPLGLNLPRPRLCGLLGIRGGPTLSSTVLSQGTSGHLARKFRTCSIMTWHVRDGLTRIPPLPRQSICP